MRLVLTVTVARQWTLNLPVYIRDLDKLYLLEPIFGFAKNIHSKGVKSGQKNIFYFNQGSVQHKVRTSILEHAPGRHRSERPRRRTEASTATSCRDRVTLRANRKILEPRTSLDTFRRARRPTATSDRVAFEGLGLLRLLSAS